MGVPLHRTDVIRVYLSGNISSVRQWAKNAVDVLHGNGAIEGYPDGTFKGDRNMSRYEYAEMLYNALMNGATVDESVIEKYQPELVQIYSKKNR